MENLKPFDLEKAKAGHPVVTRNRKKVRILSYDIKSIQPICAAITDEDIETIECFYEDGIYLINRGHCYLDLFMAPIKKTYYINIYKHDRYLPFIFDSLADAKEHQSFNEDKFVKRISLEIEE